MVSRPVTRDDRPAPRPDARRRGRRARRWVIALVVLVLLLVGADFGAAAFAGQSGQICGAAFACSPTGLAAATAADAPAPPAAVLPPEPVLGTVAAGAPLWPGCSAVPCCGGAWLQATAADRRTGRTKYLTLIDTSHCRDDRHRQHHGHESASVSARRGKNLCRASFDLDLHRPPIRVRDRAALVCLLDKRCKLRRRHALEAFHPDFDFR